MCGTLPASRAEVTYLPSITNVGTRPTFNEEPRTVIETYLLDVERDLYGRTLRLGFVQRLRDERRFENVDLLKAQVAADVQKARTLFEQMSL